MADDVAKANINTRWYRSLGVQLRLSRWVGDEEVLFPTPCPPGCFVPEYTRVDERISAPQRCVLCAP